MTIEELYNLVSCEINKSFELSQENIQKELFKDTTKDMTEQQIYAHMLLQSMIISANLSAQVVINTLINMDIISSDLLSSLKVIPHLHLVKPLVADADSSFDNQEE